VGAVAVPLAMAFAIASGLKPEAGLFTALIAGFLISALGGSRVQIGGPAGAFIVIVYGILQRYGLANLVIATAMSGVMLFLMGVFKLGTLIRFVPIAVVIGFTNGIAVLVGLSQIKDFLGLRIATMPADFFGILSALYGARLTVNPQAVAVAASSLAIIVIWQLKRFLSINVPACWSFRSPAALRPPLHSSLCAGGRALQENENPAQSGTLISGNRLSTPCLSRKGALLNKLDNVPGSIVALVFATLAVSLFDLHVDTIGSSFGGIPSSLPVFQWPAFSWESARFLLVPAATLAILGAIESLICARVADGMIHDRHDPNQELMAQGIANFITPFFGGMPATGTIARTVTNVNSGASSPIAGMVHALTILLVIVVAAPLADDIPLAALAAILMFVAWNMGEWREFAHLRNFRAPYRITLLAVFSLTVIFDLTVAVEVGLLAACVTFIYRISSLSRSEQETAVRQPALAGHEGSVEAHRLYGALFFGAVKLIETLEDRLPRRCLVVDFKNVIYIDSSGADSLLDLAHACTAKGVRLVVCGLAHQPLDIARRSGFLARIPATDVFPDLASGIFNACPAVPMTKN